MKQLPWLKSILLIATGSLLVSGCETQERVVYRQAPPPQYAPSPYPPAEEPSQEIIVTEAPPPIIVERQPRPPGPHYVWIQGGYVWHGHWEWVQGRWERPPHRGAVWVPRRYERRGNVQVFINGYWK